ncbi:phosphoribosylformylglycinamidine synthase I [Candidatus Peregrinibacteria bacterium]|nr:phosphoribosylformylglycinamidine synthase I [Candidatus Peregrinibacteria bacterium]
MIKFAVISFPGTNCEAESVRAFKRNGMDAEMVLWNDPGMLDGSRLNEFDGYLIAGGFSYEDRGRSGIVAAQDPITEVLKKEADSGKVIIGICNGAQILVETGLIPGFDNKGLAIALAWNEMKKDGEIVGTGFYNIWSHLKNVAPKARCAFNSFNADTYIPIAHGEGRFMVDDEVLQKLEDNNQIVFKYANADGQIATEFPDLPNGATASIAALCNPKGNVMAIMPHPERDPKGNGNLIFESIKKWIEEKKSVDFKPLGDYECKEDIREPKNVDIQVFVRLIITDNSERTIEEALIRKGFSLHLDRFEYFGITLNEGGDLNESIDKIMKSGELANFNKHLVFIRTKDGTFSYDLNNGLVPKDVNLDNYVIASDQKDFVGMAKLSSINHHAGGAIKDIHSGILWNFSKVEGDTVERVIKSKVLYNPHSMYLLRSA